MAALLAIIVLSIVGTVWLLDGVREGGDLARWDGPTLRWLVAHREPLATSAMTAVTTIGGEVVLSVIAALTVLVLAVRRHRVEALLVAVALGVAEAISLILKYVVGRARPPATDVLGRIEHTLSFPSGHTIGTATFTLTLAYLWWRARPSAARAWCGLSLALALTAVMATSRLYLGKHWVTDVLASIVLSFGVVSSVILVDTWMQRGPGRRDEPASGND
jgi:membrane-associated phospholipid phosphatase